MTAIRDLPEWMREFRDPLPSWTPPDELRKPTPSPPMNLALTMLTSSVIGNDLVDLIGSWISSMAGLNMWFKRPGRRALREGEYPRLLVLPGNVAERIHGFWLAYLRAVEESRAGEESSRGVAEPEYQALLDAVRDGTQAIRAAME
ncbi:hypothetical protein ACSDR0_10355 [Streptosporangium sp. G11]|uniref:hypothetical protein n=1 Tax=Streptosporangium sp. G11 TaxID=3436926 RepID=UPI003EBC0A65